MDWKRIGKALLFPHLALMIVLIPVATAALLASMLLIGTESVPAYISYVLAAYTLTVWCIRIPRLVNQIKRFKNENKYAQLWLSDVRLRAKVSLSASLAWNLIYAIFQLWLGYLHQTFWFYSFGIYYICLSLMRLFLGFHVKKYEPGERMRAELKKYRACGWVLLFMNLVLMLIVFFMLYWNRTFTHHMITTIAMAAYTFTAFTTAIVNLCRYRKYQSPVLSASKAISLVAACVSMLTLTTTMLTVFNDGSMDATSQKLMLGGVGFAVSAVVVTIAISMICIGTKKLKEEVAPLE